MPLEERSGLDTLEQLSSLVAEQTGRPIVAGMMPINLMVRTMISVGARNEPARSVLWRALQQLDPRLSWKVLCGVGEQAMCTINIHAVTQE
jgi:hypothetical protein